MLWRDAYKSVVVPIDSDALRRHAEIEPYLYHVTAEASLESILADGLKPGSEFGGRVHHGFHATRGDMSTSVTSIPSRWSRSQVPG